MKLDIIREHYFFELDRKQQLESALALPVAAIAGLIGVLTIYFKAIILGRDFDVTLLLLACLGGVLLVIGLLLTILGFYGYRYSEVDIKGAVNHYDQLQAYGAQAREAPEETEEAFESELRGRYAESVEQNRFHNQKRVFYLYWAKAVLAAATLTVGIAAIPYLYTHTNVGSEAHRIVITSGEVAVRILGDTASDNLGKGIDVGTETEGPAQGSGSGETPTGGEGAAGTPTAPAPQGGGPTPPQGGGPTPPQSGGSTLQRPVMPENIQTRTEVPPERPATPGNLETRTGVLPSSKE